MNYGDAPSPDKSRSGNPAMSVVRLTVSVAVLLVLAVGYLSSQYAYFSRDDNGANQATEWSKFVDSPVVSLAALIVFLGAISLSLIPDRGEKP